MPLTDDSLTIWKISFRWAGLNPDSLKFLFYIPYQAKDNMRLLLDAISENMLYCISLKEKDLLNPRNKHDQRDKVDLYNVISDQKYNRSFLKSHFVSRSDFAHWCKRESIPYPDFWFPTGWAIHELDQKDWMLKYNPYLAESINGNEKTKTYDNEKIHTLNESLTTNQGLWAPTITAAKTIWSQDKNLSIAEVVRKIKEMPHLQASSFSESAIRKQIAKYSPIPGKPGRKPIKQLT